MVGAQFLPGILDAHNQYLIIFNEEEEKKKKEKKELRKMTKLILICINYCSKSSVNMQAH